MKSSYPLLFVQSACAASLLILASSAAASGACYAELAKRADGCSVPLNDPTSNGYKKEFRSACDRHDICYATVGASKGACDIKFEMGMLNVCWEKRYLPLCVETATTWYGVVALSDQGQESFDRAQKWARDHRFDPRGIVTERGFDLKSRSVTVMVDGKEVAVEAGFDHPDAAVRQGHHAWFFKGTEFLRYDLDKDRAEEIRPIARHWPGLGDFLQGEPLDAALYREMGGKDKIYFFKGDRYVRFDLDSNKVDANPRRISSGWPGVPDNIDSAIGTDDAIPYNDNKTPVAYFFVGDQYYRFDYDSDKVDSKGSIERNWPGLPEYAPMAAFESLDVVPVNDHRTESVYMYYDNGFYRRYDARGDCSDE